MDDTNIANTIKSLDGLYKQVYANGVEKIPALKREVFKSESMINNYNWPDHHQNSI